MNNSSAVRVALNKAFSYALPMYERGNDKFFDMSDLINKLDEQHKKDNVLDVKLLSEQDFSQCRNEWNCLLDESASKSFFLKWEWIHSYWKTIDKKDAALLVCFCYQQLDLVGIAPFYVYQCKFMGLSVNKIAFLGDGVASDYMDVFTRSGYEHDCCREVLKLLQTESPVAFSLFEFDGVLADSNIYRYLLAGDVANDNVVVLPRFECPRALLGRDLDSYMAGLSASARYYIRRKQRKLEKSVDNLLVRHVDLSECPELLDVLFDLHEQRWGMIKDRESTFNSSFRKTFNKALLNCLEEGDGFFSFVTVDEKPASIMYLFMYKKRAYFYQNGWNPEYASYSIGIYNIQQAIQFAIEQGCYSFDFLRGPERYKYTFCNDIRQAYVIFLFASSLSGRYLHCLLLLKIGFKRLLDYCGLLNVGRSILGGVSQLKKLIK